MSAFSRISDEITEFRKFQSSAELADVIKLEHQSMTLLAKHHSPDATTTSAELVDSQYDFWRKFSNSMLDAQDAYIGSTLGQSKNKADHSREVAEGVALFFSALAANTGYMITDREIDYIKFRAHLHDGGRILNLSDEKLDKQYSDLGGKSPREAARLAAQKMLEKYGMGLGTETEIADAICFVAISAREGPLYEEAVELDPEVKEIRAYFHREDVHNPLTLDGLYNFTAHHNIPGTPRDMPGNFNGMDHYGVIDHLAIVVDKASACTGSVENLDEVALNMIYFARKKRCDPAYVRFFLEGYGSGNSLIEQWYSSCAQKGICRVPGGLNARHAEITEFVDALDGKPDALVRFPWLSGKWTPFSTEGKRRMLASQLASAESLPAYICREITTFPRLTAERVKTEIAITHAAVIGVPWIRTGPSGNPARLLL